MSFRFRAIPQKICFSKLFVEHLQRRSIQPTAKGVLGCPVKEVWIKGDRISGLVHHDILHLSGQITIIPNCPVIWKILGLFSSPISREIDHP